MSVVSIKKQPTLKDVKSQAQEAVDTVNKKIEQLGAHSGNLCDALNGMQDQFDKIRNIPSEKELEYKELKKIRLNWKQQVEKLEKDYKDMQGKAAGAGAAGVGLGVAAVAIGPTVAMGIATTFGIASTGTAICTLSGAAMFNAALAWLGGGALIAGGGGMVAGQAFLAMFGPLGWTIAACSFVLSGICFLVFGKNKKKLEQIYMLIGERDINTYKLAAVELDERIVRMDKETDLILAGIEAIKGFGTDYRAMTEKQQYMLGSYLNLMNSSTQLLVNPIMSLLPKVTENDFEAYLASDDRVADKDMCSEYKNQILALSAMLYKIQLDDSDIKTLFGSLRRNKKYLESLKIEKKQFTQDILNAAEDFLNYLYEQEEKRDSDQKKKE